jgi:hypothetical protein
MAVLITFVISLRTCMFLYNVLTWLYSRPFSQQYYLAIDIQSSR